MRLCLVFPKTTVFEDPMVFPPLGLFYLRAVLEQEGHQTTFIDLSEYDRETRVEKYPDADSIPPGFDAYLISGTSPQAREIRKVCKHLRDRGELVIVGGPHATNYGGTDLTADQGLVRNAHVVVRGEGETAILEALRRLDDSSNTMTSTGRGIVVQHKNVDDLGQLPIPNREAATLYHYYLDGDDGDRRRGTTMFSSRGCPEQCKFCDSPALWGRKVRYTPMHRVIEELEQIESLGFHAVHFFDDILPLHRGRMTEMAEQLRLREFIWRCFFRVDIMSKYGKEFLQLMHGCGLREALVGVESGSQSILDGIKKGTTVEQNTVVREWCREVGIRFKASVILGLPGESQETMESTKRWVMENRPDKVNLCLFIPFTGTPIVKNREEYDVSWGMDAGALEEHFYAGGWNTLRSLVSTSHVSAEQIQDFYHGFIADLERTGISH